MSTATSTTPAPSNTQTAQPLTESVVAVYQTHTEAEDAVRKLERGGIPIDRISIIGRDFQMREDVQGYYRPSDAVKEGAGFGAWFGGLFGLMLGFGFFVFPVAGPLVVLGPLAGILAGAVSGAGIGALVSGLMSLGMSKNEALKYEKRLEAGEFLVSVTGTHEQIETARYVLQGTGEVDIQTFQALKAA